MASSQHRREPASALDSPTFTLDASIRVDQPVGSMSISPCGRDVVLASRQGLHIIDLDAPYSPPRQLPHRTPWEVADVQWSPFAARDYWVVSTSNQKALVWNLAMASPSNAIEHVLHAHSRAITDINFSAHHPDILATCAVDAFVHCWDLRSPARPSTTFCDWIAGATQVKWNRQDPHILASSHDKLLRIWDDRKGAYPLRTIKAHDTKIYGVDWNRVRSSSVVTCSLDKSIKMWDYENPEDEPERVIRTPFPVWRARHTPCGWGLLAMPQRGNTDLHLFDRRLERDAKKDAAVSAVHRFEGHQDQVKEFLWRPRGNIVDGIDNREFQLVSWGSDRDLRLHRVDDETLGKIGYQKGREVFKSYIITRKDAQYKTFRDDPEQDDGKSLDRATREGLPGRDFSSALGGALNAGLKKAPIPLSKMRSEGGYMTSRMRGEQEVSALTWLKGVKIGMRKTAFSNGHAGTLPPLQSDLSTPRAGNNHGWDAPENLGDEITQAADKFSKVTFEGVNVSKRTATVSMSGPWASEGKAVYTKVHIDFPNDYPASVAPMFKLEETASMTKESAKKINEELGLLAEVYRTKGRACLEAILCYLLGEQGLVDSIAWASKDPQFAVDAEGAPSLSSSDEEDDIDVIEEDQVQGLDASGAELPGIMNANAKVPLPKQCGASFAKNGSLICFFPHKEEPSWFDLSSTREDSRNDRSRRIFQGFGRLRRASPGPGGRLLTTREAPEGNSDSDDSFTSSSASSAPSDLEDPSAAFSRLTNSWRQGVVRTARYRRFPSTDRSQRSTALGSALSKPASNKIKSFVSIHNLEDLLPAKKVLAQGYRIFGDGPEVCQHNADVAADHGYEELANIWLLAKLILYNEVPLEVLDQPHRKEPILVLANQATRVYRRREDAQDTEGDRTIQQVQARLTGRVRWGCHPFANAWLIEAMFKHFESLADSQTLAMLSCVFSEPLTRSSVSNALMDLNQQQTPISMKSPAFSLDYFPSAEIAWSFYQPATSTPSAPRELPSPVAIYGSLGSSIGLWGSDLTTPHSTGTTTPIEFRSGRSSVERGPDEAHSLSTSPYLPDTSMYHSRRSTANFTSAFAASLTRPFVTQASSSSPSSGMAGKRRVHTSDSSGGVTWGQNTIFGGHAAKESGNVYDATYSESVSEEDEPPATLPNYVRVTLKNQSLFDTEGGAAIPLLDPSKSSRYRAYREAYANMLMIWGLRVSRLEVLKFNGMRNYYPEADESLGTMLGRKRPKPSHRGHCDGLTLDERCLYCGGIIQNDHVGKPASKCRDCGRIQREMGCSLCNNVVLGIHVPCLACGHILHPACYVEWFVEDDRECPTGCGCPCPDASLDRPYIALQVVECEADDGESRMAIASESPETHASFHD